MPVIWNNEIEVELDKHWPRIIKMTEIRNKESIKGCDPGQPFKLEVNNEYIQQEEMTPVVSADDTSATYNITIPSLNLMLKFQFNLEKNEIIVTLPEVHEGGSFKLSRLYIPEHRLITGTAEHDDRYLRVITRRSNWSGSWGPGASFFNKWEDLGKVGDGIPERGAQITDHACVWNKNICVAITTSIRMDPLVSVLESKAQKMTDRAGQFSIWAGVYSYRLHGELAEPLEIRIALLNNTGKGSVNWCDAANWEGDRKFKFNGLYNETIVYKLYLDDLNRSFPLLSFSDVLSIIRDIHSISNGLKQVVYLVGWQYKGHDTGYPCHTVINERAGGQMKLNQLINDAKKYNAIVSLHVNFDDSYEEYPEFNKKLLSRDSNGKPYVWFFNKSFNNLNVYSISHTLQVETGYAKDRMKRMLELIPLKESIHFDSHRPFNEVWLPDGTHIDAECEIQRGMVPIKKMFMNKGIDITIKNCGDDGIYSWGWHMPDWKIGYITVMCHGRVQGANRKGIPGEALGCSIIRDEFKADSYETMVQNFYMHWMYAQILYRKKIEGYRLGAWNQTVEVNYEHETRVQSGFTKEELQAEYEGIPLARGTDRFLPWRENIIYAFSLKGGLKEWILPPSWSGANIKAVVLTQGGEIPGPKMTIEGRTIKFQAPESLPVKIMRR